jgi:hypothetical protein
MWRNSQSQNISVCFKAGGQEKGSAYYARGIFLPSDSGIANVSENFPKGMKVDRKSEGNPSIYLTKHVHLPGLSRLL